MNNIITKQAHRDHLQGVISGFPDRSRRSIYDWICDIISFFMGLNRQDYRCL